MASHQIIHASNLNPDLGEALSCRVKDPLWFLARQWQTGEFEAENGGTAALAIVEKTDWPLRGVMAGGVERELDRALPLEAAIEAETASGDAEAWAAEALEYRASVTTDSHRLEADSYHGRDLDWWHFDIVGRGAANRQTDTVRMVPANLNVRGAPHPRWWRFEEGDVYLDAPEDPEPNVLSVLMPEFIYADIEDWHLIPLPISAGSVREIESVSVVDSFGIVTRLDPSGGANWRCFTPTNAQDRADASILFVPNIAFEVLNNETIEDVLFQRDEQSNLVWAIERIFTGEDGTPVHASDTAAPADTSAGMSPEGFDSTYKLQSNAPRHFIPYIPVFSKPNATGETYLRRGRTDVAAGAGNPQYQGTLLKASSRLHEEELGVSGVRVRRVKRSVQASDGRFVEWIARVRDVTEIETNDPNLRFDYSD